MTVPPSNPPTPSAHLSLTVHIPKYVWVAFTAACVALVWAALFVTNEWVAASQQARGVGIHANAPPPIRTRRDSMRAGLHPDSVMISDGTVWERVKLP